MTDAATIDRPEGGSDRTGGTYNDALNAMAGEFRRLLASSARSELAAMRRIEPEHPGQAAFFRLMAGAVPDHLLGRDDLAPAIAGSRLDMVRRWALIARIMAERPESLTAGNLGRSLKAAGYSDQRLNMLLNARGQTFRDLTRRAARRLAHGNEGMPYRELGRLILLESRPEHDRETEELRVRIAMEFQRASSPGDQTDSDE